MDRIVVKYLSKPHQLEKPARRAKGSADHISDDLERAQASATMAPPRHMPVPIRWMKSTTRMVARVGRVSMLQRPSRPKAARTKTTRRDSRRELMNYHLLSTVVEERGFT